MKHKQVLSLFLTLVLIGGYIAFQYYYNKDDNTAPVITFDSDMIKVKADASDEDLLEGVTASDQEDGDLTDDILIDSISAFNSEEERTITYVVFDKDNKSTSASRKLKYKKYTAPKFTVSDSLLQSSLTMTKINTMIGATSSVDGNIDGNVEIKTGTYEDHKMPLDLTVSDSTGTESHLSLIYEYDNTSYTSDIVLKKYLIYVKAGKEADLEDNIDSVMVGNSEYVDLMDHVVIKRGDLDYDVPGLYDIYYSLDDETNFTAKCKAVVVVQ